VNSAVYKNESIKSLFHGVLTSFYIWVFAYSFRIISEGQSVLDAEGKIPKYGGGFKYLTHINQWLHLIFFTLQFLTDLLPETLLKSKLKYVLSLFFSLLIIPTTFTVTFFFWVIYSIDRRLVYPEVFDLVVPPHLNHFWHTTILLWVFLEIVVCDHVFPSNGTAVVVNFFLNLSYISWTVWIFLKTGFWVYGIFEVLSPPLLALFWAGSMFISFGFFLVGKSLSNLRWNRPINY